MLIADRQRMHNWIGVHRLTGSCFLSNLRRYTVTPQGLMARWCSIDRKPYQSLFYFFSFRFDRARFDRMGKPITATTDDGYALSFYDSDRIGEEMVQSNFGRCVLIRLAPFAFTAAVDHTGSRGLFFFNDPLKLACPRVALRA